jgi:hypothetical protein
MKRIIAAGVMAGFAIILTGCPSSKDDKEIPPASTKFDRKEMPKTVNKNIKGGQPQ